MRAYPFATVVTHGPEGIAASHLPLLLRSDESSLGTLWGHFARPNPQWSACDRNADVLAIFHGPHHYVSPSWYPSKDANGRAVPTWNYLAVHAYGPLEIIENPEQVRVMLSELTKEHEARFRQPWRLEDAPESYIAGLQNGITAFRVPLRRLEGKRKLSQNRPAEDRVGVQKGLRLLGNEQALAVADQMDL